MVAEYRTGSGPDQLAHGGATEANDAPEFAPPAGIEAGPAPEMADEAPQMATPADFEPIFEPATDDEAFITAPTTRPDEAQFVGAEPTKRLSAQSRKSLKTLQEAAARPGASASLKALVAQLLRSA